MPYIDQETRANIAPSLNELIRQAWYFRSAGTLNYTITQLVIAALGHKPTYVAFNTVLGVLEAVKLELHRRMVAPYEDTKCDENGDVFPPLPHNPNGGKLRPGG